MTLMIVAILVFLGLIFGSFVNAWVWRLHEQETLLEKKRKPSKKKLAELSILKGHSMCPSCRHELAAKDLVPVFSWLWLRGKCRYCHKPISAQYPIVEALTAVLFVVSYIFWPLTFHGADLAQFVFWLFFAVNFMALAVYDLKWYLLPNRIVYPLIIVAIVETLLVGVLQHDVWFIIDAAIGALIISGLFYALFQISAGRWIGGGDVKLAVILGLLAGTAQKALLVLFFASMVGTVVSLPLAMRTKQGLKLQVPFGPFLLIATVITVLWGGRIIDLYTSVLL